MSFSLTLKDEGSQDESRLNPVVEQGHYTAKYCRPIPKWPSNLKDHKIITLTLGQRLSLYDFNFLKRTEKGHLLLWSFSQSTLIVTCNEKWSLTWWFKNDILPLRSFNQAAFMAYCDGLWS